MMPVPVAAAPPGDFEGQDEGDMAERGLRSKPTRNWLRAAD